jgi:hypothetical protein
MTLTKIIHNVETGEIVELELTEAEIAEAEVATAKAEADKIKKAEATAAKAALLEKLGITEDEAKLLLS